MINIAKTIIQLLSCLLLVSPVFADSRPLVFFDQSHGQAFLADHNRPLDLSGLAAIFTEEGANVVTDQRKLNSTSLAQIDVLIISGPFIPFSEQEIKDISKYVRKGGRLAIMAHIAQPVAKLLNQLGMAISNGAVNEQKNIIGKKAKDFMITQMIKHPLTNGLDSFMIYGGWALLTEKGNLQTVASSSDEAWVDLNRDGALGTGDAQQSFGMVAAGSYGEGSLAVFGDDAIFQNRFLLGGNQALARNLARWLCQHKLKI